MLAGSTPSDSFGGLEVFKFEDETELLGQYAYQGDETDDDVLARIAEEYEIVEYSDGAGNTYTDF